MSKAIPEPVTKLIEAFSRLPSIGPKTAARLTYYLLREQDDTALVLAEALTDMKTKTRFCSNCYNITTQDVDPCAICSDPDRDKSTIVVVEEPLDVQAVERTGGFEGQYHVLHGVITGATTPGAP